MDNHIIQQIFNSITERTYELLVEKNINKKNIYSELLGCELLGCDLLMFDLYLMDKLEKGMTFDNYGEWKVDYIKPISLFNLDNDDELFEFCNYTNLKLVWKKDNIL
jgi:hypothetical protein